MIERTSVKDLLAASLVELANSKPVDKITVRDICNNCGLTTATFYNHFKDKYDLMFWVSYSKTDTFIDKFGVTQNWYETLYQCNEMMVSYGDFMKNVTRHTDGMDLFNYNTLLQFSEYVINHLKKLHQVDEFDDKTIHLLYFYFTAYSYSTVDWLKNDGPCSLDEFTQLCVEGIPRTLEKLFFL